MTLQTGPRQLRRASVIEATSYLLLLVAMIFKYADRTDVGVTIMGPVHGVLYLIFVALVVRERPTLGWDWSRAIVAMAIGSLPFGGFWLDREWLADHSGEM